MMKQMQLKNKYTGVLCASPATFPYIWNYFKIKFLKITLKKTTTQNIKPNVNEWKIHAHKMVHILWQHITIRHTINSGSWLGLGGE